MILKGKWRLAVKALALLLMTVVCTGFFSTYVSPVDVYADEDLYQSLYDVFRDRSEDPDEFMTQERFVERVMGNCELLYGIDYTYGTQEKNLGCDGFVSLVLRLTLDTVYNFTRDRDNYWCKYDYREEHIVAASHVDRYEVFRPGGTTVTWLYKTYVDEIVESLDGRESVEGMDNDEWIDYLEDIGALPGDIIFWDDDSRKDYWTHIGIYAGIEDGVAMMWHASSIKGYVCKQSLEEITYNVGYLKYAAFLPLTDRPAKAGLCVDADDNGRDFSYSFYKDPECEKYIGRISSTCTLSEQSYLDEFMIYPSDNDSVYERTLYFKRDISPFNIENSDICEDQGVYQLIVSIEPEDGETATLKYSVYGMKDIRFYAGGKIEDYDYMTGGKVIPISDFR